MARICELYSFTKSFNKDFWLATFNRNFRLFLEESEKEKKVSIKEKILLMGVDYCLLIEVPPKRDESEFRYLLVD